MTKAKTKFRDNTFHSIIIGDVVKSQERLQADDNQSNRRDLVRTAFAAIEGLHWQAKQVVRSVAKAHLTTHELAALAEETYVLSDDGRIKATSRFLPMTASVRLLVRAIQKFRPDYSVDFQHAGWAALKASVSVRNRLVHPKAMSDLEVSEQDIEHALRGFNWMLALAIDANEQTLTHVVEGFDRAVESTKS